MTPEPGSRKWLWHAVESVTPEANGLMRLRSGTGGGVLTRRKVFDAMSAPWWQQGQYDPEMFFEDIFFYDRATAAGLDIWGDPSVRFGHYQSTVLWPHQREDGTWSTVLAHGFDGFLEQPWPTPLRGENRLNEAPAETQPIRDEWLGAAKLQTPVGEALSPALVRD